MKEIIALAKHIEHLDIKLLNTIKAKIAKVDWRNLKTKSLVFAEPLIHEMQVLEEDGHYTQTIYIYEIFNHTSEKALSFRYTEKRYNNEMFNDDLWIDEDNGSYLLHQIAKHIEHTDVSEGHILNWHTPSEKLGIAWEWER